MLKVIDISDYQNVDSFHAVKASGFDVVVCKATQGTGNVQDTFAGYAPRARSVGLTFGAYHFLSWTSDPKAQAEHFLSVYKPQNGDLVPMLDCEACAVSEDRAIAQISGFLQTVAPHIGGADQLLYMSYSFPNDHLRGGAMFSGLPLWVAAYENPSHGFPDVTPTAWSGKTPGVQFWQYTDDLTVPGIIGSKNVDGDLFIGDAAALKALTLRGLA